MVILKEAKTELEDLVKKHREGIDAGKEANLPTAEKEKLAKDRAMAEKDRKDAEAKAKVDADLITKDDKDLDEAGRKRKAELIKINQDAEDKKLDPKILKIKKETQARINELTTSLKSLENKTSEDAVSKQKELDELQVKNKELEEKIAAGPVDETAEAEADADNAEQERITKYIERDKDKPREKRLEMNDDELDAWLAEEPGKAQAWITRREMRRNGEKLYYSQGISQATHAKNFIAKQTEMAKKVEEKHPEVNVDKRYTELKGEGKEHEEIMKTIREENPKYRACADLLKENPKKYLNTENGPELMIVDMEKRLSSKGSEDADKETITDLTKRLEDAEATIQEILTGDKGINSSQIKVRLTKDQITKQEETLISTMKDVNASQTMIDAALVKLRKKNAQ